LTSAGHLNRPFKGSPGIGGVSLDVHVALGYVRWNLISSRTALAWTLRGDTPRIEDVGSTSWKQLRSSRGMLEMMMMGQNSGVI